MKKKLPLLLAFLLVALTLPQGAKANMAAPAESDIGSAITFRENDAVAVLSEVLEIAVTGAQADITATYRLRNTAAEAVVTPAMFLSPNVEDSGARVTVDGAEAPCTVERYALNYSTAVETADWRYAVLSEEDIADHDGGRTVDCVSFEMAFAPGQEFDVVVSYVYALGGYPDYDFNAKRGELTYYLTPAALWKDFSDLTIELRLDEDMPVLKSSTLPFEKVAERTYRYTSDTLPEEDLSIVIDENWLQNIFSTLRSPYLAMSLTLLLPPILIVLALVILLVVLLRRRRKNRAGKGGADR